MAIVPAEAVMVRYKSADGPTTFAVTRVRTQPLEIMPLFNCASSSTNNCHEPFGLRPFNAESVEPYGGGGGERCVMTLVTLPEISAFIKFVPFGVPRPVQRS